MKKNFFLYGAIIGSVVIFCGSISFVYAADVALYDANLFDAFRGFLQSIREQFVAAQTLFTTVVIEQKPLEFTPSDKNFENQSVSFFEIGSKNVPYEIQGTSRERYVRVPLGSGIPPISQGRVFRVDTETNDAPFFTSLPKDKTIRPGKIFMFMVKAEDLEQDALTYSALNLPPGASFNSKTGKFSWKPSVALAGNTYIVTFIVRDDQGKEIEKKMRLSVQDTDEDGGEEDEDNAQNDNTAPLFDSHDSDVSAEVGEEIRLTVSATDEDNDAFIFSVTPLPKNATLSETTGEFVWTPDASQVVMDKVLRFKVTDARGLFDTQEIVFTITAHADVDEEDDVDIDNKNHEPKLDHIGNKVAMIDKKLKFLVRATDRDGDVLSLDATEFPDNDYTIDRVEKNTWHFSWTPQSKYYETNDTADVTLTVDDGELEDSETLTFTMKGGTETG